MLSIGHYTKSPCFCENPRMHLQVGCVGRTFCGDGSRGSKTNFLVVSKCACDLSCSQHCAHLISSESLTPRLPRQHVMWTCGARFRSSHHSRVECKQQSLLSSSCATFDLTIFSNITPPSSSSSLVVSKAHHPACQPSSRRLHSPRRANFPFHQSHESRY